MGLLSSIIGAVGSLTGGSMSANAAKEAEQQRMHWERIQMQNKLQWAVQDGEKAGIHPLAAIGSNVPLLGGSVGGGNPGALGDVVGRAAEIIAEQIDSAQAEQRLADATTEKTRAETRLINEATSRTQIAKARASATDPNKPLIWNGRVIEPNPNYSDVEGFTVRYGEGADWVGPHVWERDMNYNRERERKGEGPRAYDWITPTQTER
jgi:hypothetical protein